MTDAHCHVTGGDTSVRELLIGRDFFGVHPWEIAEIGPEDVRRKTEDLASRLASSGASPLPNPIGIGEIGLDRLKEKKISPLMRSVFETQLKLAAELHCPVVLHGAKCWGEVIATVRRILSSNNQGIDRTTVQSPHHPILQSPNHPILQSPNSSIPAFLFHGFSRSDGLLPDIVALNGFVSVGPAVLNDHAVNYRELVKKIPLERLLLETDRTPENAATCPSVAAVAAKVAELRGLSLDELELLTDQNATAFQQTCHDFS